jgi:Tfp pilus assembly PilM family ATPase
MPQLLALEWNGAEARVAAASLHGGQVVVEQAFSITIPPGDGAGEHIAAALAARGLGRGEALVAVGRSSIELRQFQLPAVPDEELAEIVQFQAIREFSELTEDWRLDFLPIDDDPGSPRNVLAAAIAPGPLGQIEAECQAAGLKPRRLLLRPCAAASLLTRARPPRPDELRLVVDLLADEAELTAVLGGKVIFLRTARLCGDPPHPKPLLPEVRRTMAALQNQSGGRKVESIVLCGWGQAHAALARAIEDDLGTPTTLFDPFVGLTLGRDVQNAPPEHVGRFAPVLGMLLAELEHSGHAFDFLNPRRPVPPPNQRKRLILAGVAAAVLLVGWLLYARIQHYRLASQVAELERQSKALDDAAARAAKVNATAAAITKVFDGETVWLDQLRALSRDLPPQEDAMLEQLTFAPTPPKSSASAAGSARAASSSPDAGKMHMTGLIKRSETIEAMRQGLGSHRGNVVVVRGPEDRSVRVYSWRFDASASVPQEPAP